MQKTHEKCRNMYEKYRKTYEKYLFYGLFSLRNYEKWVVQKNISHSIYF